MSFRTEIINVGPLVLMRLHGDYVGNYLDSVVHEDVKREDLSTLAFVVKGVRRWEALDGSYCYDQGPGEMGAGDMKAGVVYRTSAMTDDMEYFCIRSRLKTRVKYEQFTLSEGEEKEVPTAQCAIVGGGETNFGGPPLVVVGGLRPKVIRAIDTNVFGILLFL